MKTEFDIKVGETFKIELISNPSTGYSWKWVNKQEISIIDTIKHQFIADRPDQIGGGGKEIWHFKGLKTGSTVIKLGYNRSWESGVDAQSKEISVNVK